MIVLLKNFLTTGVFGDIAPGTNEAEIRNKLGPPALTGGITNRQSRPSVLKYGSLEIGFAAHHERICTLLHIEPVLISNSFSFPDSIKTQEWDITPDSTSKDVKEYLRHKLPSFDFIENREGQEIVIVQSRVRLVFDDDLLWSISASL